MTPLLSPRLRRRCVLAAAIALLIVSSDANGLAQGQPPGPMPQAPVAGAQPQTPPAPPSMPRIVVTAGRSTVADDRLRRHPHCDHQSGGGGGDRRRRRARS